MSIIRYPKQDAWLPFGGLSQFRDEVNRLLEGTLGVSGEVGALGGWAPPLDLYQDKDHLYVKIELPGMKKEEIELSLYEGVLTIAGERKQESKSGEGKSLREERFYGRFQRSVTLPAEVDAEKISATYRDGILEVTLPKSEAAKPKQIEVSVD